MQSRNLQQDDIQRITPNASDVNPTVRPAERSIAADKAQMSVIGADIVVTGNIEASVDLHIEGQVIGDVRCATLILGENSSVQGRIYAARVKVSGTVDGAIETKDLAIEAAARVTGDVTYERLRVANGGLIEGSMTRRIPEEGDEANKLKLVEAPQQAPAATVERAAERMVL
jgi:cytoskeletal protein CcmA (bactofilin family)